MIRVESITVREFRGIRDLTLTLGSQNFAVCGPNGTGKSGIVDAVEFALTGNVSRLSGAGTGGLSVKDHGPHVDSRNNPENASVTVSISIPTLNKNAVIERTVKDARKPKITPKDKDILAVLEQVANHPEFTLSRRELIRYVLSEPGKRSKEVQSLLRLEELESLRTTLQKIANAEEKGVATLARSQRDASDNLLRALSITQLSASRVIEAANAKRTILSLPTLSSLDATTSIKDGVVTAAGTPTVSRVPKVQAQADIQSLREQLDNQKSEAFLTALLLAKDTVAALGKDAKSLDGIARQELLQSALELFDDQACPVCGTEWEPKLFREVVAAKLKHFDEVAARRKAAEAELEPIAGQLEILGSTLALVSRYGTALAPPTDTKTIGDWASILHQHVAQIRKLLPLSDTRFSLEAVTSPPVEVYAALDALATKISALPEPSQQDAARDFLSVGQERLGTYRSTTLKLKSAQEKAGIAASVLELYGKLTTAALEEIYKKVETAFTAFYRSINHEDEETFEAQLIPSMGKLGFDVDFYGRGFFPPGAYHSEGHQDGMGVCLYLALMKYLLADQFTFAVLDDVLMSVDSGHRREVSKLLRQQFPNTQLILTTHDEVWLRHMRSEGLIAGKNFAHFRTWSVDNGPTEWDGLDVWGEIDAHLMMNDVPQAAALLRRYLEHLSHEICHRLRARVEFRGDAHFMLGDLLPPAIGAMRQHLKTGKATAHSWGRKEEFDQLQEREQAFALSASKSTVENWQLNTAVHYNEWAALQKEDFTDVVVAFRDLMGRFACSECASLFFVTPDRGPQTAMRCNCARTNINLVSKAKS